MVLSAAVVLMVGTLLFTLFVRSQDVPDVPAVSPTAHLEERKAAIYENLRDLQFEYRVGKLSDADYQQTKAGLQKELAVVIGEIGAFSAGAAITPKAKPALKANATAAPAKVPVATPTVVCPHCGATFQKPMKFCGECGKAMA